MSYSLRGSCFGGQSSLGGVGGWWDNLTGSSYANTDNGSSSNFTSCPLGYSWQYSPTTNTGTCIPAPDTLVSVEGVTVPAGTTVVTGGCPKGFKKVQFSPTYSECMADPQSTIGVGIITGAGVASYLPGATSQSPTIYCPPGTNLDEDRSKCIKGSTYPTDPPGTSVPGQSTVPGGTKPTTPTTPGIKPTTPVVKNPIVATLPSTDQAGITDALPLVAAAVLLIGGAYLASQKRRS